MLLDWLPYKIFIANLEKCKQVDPRDQSQSKLPVSNCSIPKDGYFRNKFITVMKVFIFGTNINKLLIYFAQFLLRKSTNFPHSIFNVYI